METDDFRVMFEYVFPVKKMFNLLFIMMDQNVSAFMLNGPRRGLNPFPEFPRNVQVSTTPPITERLGLTRRSILSAANIDPEQFMNAKATVKSILENVNNSDNYRVGNQAIRVLKEQIRKK